MEHAPAPLPLILDCDNTLGVPGCDVDDGLTLLYLLGQPSVQLLGVTCSYGNSTQEIVYRNTLRLLREWGRTDIPVLRGAEAGAPRQSEAADFLAVRAAEHPGSLWILATGAMTNLLGAQERSPAFFSQLAGVSLMGGVTGPLLVGGRPMGELNLSCDPQASLAVLTRPAAVRVAAAQNCLDSFFPGEEVRSFLAGWDSPAVRSLREPLDNWLALYRREWGLDGFVNWDMLAAVQLACPELAALSPVSISPTPDSLSSGQLMGGGPPCTVQLPRILQPKAYRQHVYAAFRAARIVSS